jgi:hypothetical protein
MQRLERREMADFRREACQLVVVELQQLKKREASNLGREARQLIVGEN